MNGFIGIDEVGRGCWAGPLLVVAAKSKLKLPVGLKDSKLLTKKQRNELFGQIINSCQLGEGWVQPSEIDRYGLTQAMRFGVARALVNLRAKPEERIVIDGHVNYCPNGFSNVQTVVSADAIHPIVSAASIYAKVLRDEHMTQQAKVFPDYGFEKHVGYGTKFHIEKLKLNGPCSLHRMSYKPIKAFSL